MAKRPKDNVSRDVKIATLDAETDPFRRGRVPKPFVWGFYDGETYCEYYDTAEMIAEVRTFKGIVYAHNGGKFDFHFLLQYMERDKPIMIINGRLVECQIGEATLRDSYALLPAPLSAYKKDEINYKIFEKGERNKAQNKKLISKYLQGDCVYLYNLIDQFIVTYGLHMTQAGASMKTWLDMADSKAPQSKPKFFTDFSRFYFGGRVEVFKAGHIKTPLVLMDINSAYPWAMLTPHPYGLTYVMNTKPCLDDLEDTTFIEVTCVSNGALPYRDDSGKITFPNDNLPRLYYAIGHEFIAAMESNSIRAYTLHRSYKFTDKRDFKLYIDHFYALRLKAKEMVKAIERGESKEDIDYWKAQDLFAKLLMNSLYGKFGSNPENYGHYIFVNNDFNIADYQQEGYEEYATLDGVPVLRADLTPDEMRFFNVATAASITSQVRALLFRTIQASEAVAYCDTDSVLCKTFGGDEGTALGQWKHEQDITEAWIAGKKMYALKKAKKDKDGAYKIASKGVRLDAKDIKEMVAGKTILHSPQVPTFSLKKSAVFTKRSVKMLDEIRALV